MDDSFSSMSASSGVLDRFISGFNSFFLAVFSYSTVREAKVHNFKVTFIFRVIQISILTYIIGWVIVKIICFETCIIINLLV